MREETKESSEQVYVYRGEASVPSNVTHVQVHPSVVEIVAKAFRNCKYLREITFFEGLRIIGQGAFESCISLQTVELPSTVIEIRDQAFLKCFALQFVRFSKNLELIGDEAFALCDTLKSVDIPSKTERIGDNAFMSCEDLVSVGLWEGSLREIGEDAFCGCMSLGSIRVPSTVYEIREGCFSACESLVSVELHWQLRKIHDHAFDGCSKLRNVALASSVEEIGKDAFANCISLQSQYGNIEEGLRRRFDDKPIHELCYYQSYFPTNDLMEALKTAFASFDQNGQQLDLMSTDNGAGMTPLAILSMSKNPNFSFAKGLISVHTVQQLTGKDSTGHTIADYLCTNDTPACKKLVIFTVEQIIQKRVDALSFERWKAEIRDALYELPSGLDADARQKHVHSIYSRLNDRELMESI